MKLRGHSWFKVLGAAGCMLALWLAAGIQARACDIAVVSASASSTGRPFIWKNYDSSADYQQQVKYFSSVGNGGNYMLLHRQDEVTSNLNGGDDRCSQGGVNANGFAMACTSVYEDYITPINETRNMNVTFMREAIENCRTLSEFDSFIKTWPSSNRGRTISGNFAVIDASGGAALYEMYTGSTIMTDNTTPYIQYRKYNANNGVITTDTGATSSTTNAGYFVRTNSHTWIPDNPGSERLAMAAARLSELRSAGTLNPRNTMLTVSKDLTQGRVLNSTTSRYANWTTTYCVSRSATRSGMVVDGVRSGYDPDLATFWVCMGEPSIGVFVPYFVAAGAVSPYAYMDTLSSSGAMTDSSDTCLLAMAEDTRETYSRRIYNSNRGDIVMGPYDTTINRTNLDSALTWIKPIETTIYTNTTSFLDSLRSNSYLVTASNLLNFSNYCARYAYLNYTNASSSYMAWDYSSSGSSGGTGDDTTVPVLAATMSLQTWGLGYVANITVRNTGTAATTAWEVDVRMNNSSVTNAWNASRLQSGNIVTFKSMSYNNVIAVNGSQTFGFQGLASSWSNYTPTIVAVRYSSN